MIKLIAHARGKIKRRGHHEYRRCPAMDATSLRSTVIPWTAAFRKDVKAVKVQWAGKGGGSQGTGDSRAEDILARNG